MDNSNKTFMAFLAGAAAGVAIGLLMAPDSGQITRDKLSRQADSLIDDLEDQWEVGFQKIRELTDSALAEAERLRERGEEELNNGRS
jgi:gas vesicle protein